MSRRNERIPNLAEAAVEFERHLLGHLIEEPHRFGQIDLPITDFGLTGHQITYGMMCALAKEGRTWDRIVLEAELRKCGELEQVGPPGYIEDLTLGLVRGIALGEYVARIREAAQRRSQWEESERWQRCLLDISQDPNAVKEEHRARLDALRNGHAPISGPTPMTSELLLVTRRWFERFVVMTESQLIVNAVWSLHTYVWEVAYRTPYLHVFSADKESGKTHLLTAHSRIARTPVSADEISVAALRRVPGQLKPTLFLDEMDALLKGDKETAETIRKLLNSGFRRNGCALLSGGRDKGFALERHPSFCPKVLASIGALWDTVASRSIPNELERMKKDQVVEDIDDDEAREPEAEQIRAPLERWREWALPKINAIPVEKVPGLGFRQQNICHPLMQIAALAGPEWVEALREALREVFGVNRRGEGQDASLGDTLLGDIRAIFAERGVDRMSSKSLAEDLCKIEGRPWADWKGPHGFTPNQLAKLLDRYHIIPGKVRIGDETPRGYHLKNFFETFDRYLPPSPFPPFQNGTMPQPASTLDETAFSERNRVN